MAKIIQFRPRGDQTSRLMPCQNLGHSDNLRPAPVTRVVYPTGYEAIWDRTQDQLNELGNAYLFFTYETKNPESVFPADRAVLDRVVNEVLVAVKNVSAHLGGRNGIAHNYSGGVEVYLGAPRLRFESMGLDTRRLFVSDVATAAEIESLILANATPSQYQALPQVHR